MTKNKLEKFISDYPKLQKSELLYKYEITEWEYEKLKRKHKLDDSQYIMCLWWLSGDSIHEIAFIFACTEYRVEKALKNEKMMLKALSKRLKGIYALKRNKGDILKKIGYSAEKEKEVDKLIQAERERGVTY